MHCVCVCVCMCMCMQGNNKAAHYTSNLNAEDQQRVDELYALAEVHPPKNPPTSFLIKLSLSLSLSLCLSLSHTHTHTHLQAAHHSGNFEEGANYYEDVLSIDPYHTRSLAR